MAFLPGVILSPNCCCRTALAQDISTLAQKLQTAVEDTRSEFNLTGVSAALIFNGETFTGVSGYPDVYASRKIEPDTLFPLSSITKTFIATVTLKLAEEGLLDLDETIGSWLTLPEKYSNRINDTVTIRQLLNHTSGFHSYLANPLFYFSVLLFPHKEWAPEETLNFVFRPYHAPAEEWHYSSTNYILLGMIIEKATASSVVAELHNHIFEPLNLNRIFMRGQETVSGEIAFPYLMAGKFPIDLSFLVADPYLNLIWTSGALYSSAEDLALFSNGLFGGTLLNQNSLDQMFTLIPDVTLPLLLKQFSYGLGMMSIDHEKLGTVRFSVGAAPGHFAWMIYLPDANLTCSLIINPFPNPSIDSIWYPIEHFLNIILSD